MKYFIFFLIILVADIHSATFISDQIEFLSKRKDENEILMNESENTKDIYFYKGKSASYQEMVQFYQAMEFIMFQD